MREILFRGRSVDPIGNPRWWVYGSLIKTGDYCCILPDDDGSMYDYPYLDSELGTIDGCAIPVNPETVGQFTGLLDKNGKKIFEGDILKTKYGRLCTVVWFSSQVCNGWDLMPICTCNNLAYTKPPTAVDLYMADNLEIIGNIHDNPELLKEPV